MAKIPLSKGLFATVDDEDFERLSKFKWCAVNMGGRWYATRGRWAGEEKKSKSVPMHRDIIVTDAKDIDHIDGDGLNNTRANLRPATRAQNLWNSRKTRGKSRFKGVHFHTQNKKWRATIMAHGKKYELGCHSTEEQAALAYDKAAAELFGEFARLNLAA
jgi:hypothetical protein